MKLLVIGGSRFVGKHFVEEAVVRGHEVTLFNRGNNPPPGGVMATIEGDRNEHLDRLAGGRWDAVLDTSAYFPRQVRLATEVLGGRVGTYALVSTISVYADPTTPGLDEGSALIELDDPTTEEVTNETYGGLKVLCERALAETFAGGRLVVRPGLVVGPDDPTDRFTYWPVRIARGREVLAPVGPSLPVQVIDVRDLAAFMLGALESGTAGTYNAVSEAGRFDMGDVIRACLAASGSDAQVSWVSEAFLLEAGVGPFVELPLWIPGEHANLARLDVSRALAAGLRVRPLEETVEATLAWHRAQPERPWRAGLSLERERELLEAWRSHEAGGDSG